MPYTPEQLATRYHNASTKLGSITDILDSLNNSNEHGEAIATWAGSTLYYLNHLCDILDSKVPQLRAGHTRTPRATLHGTRVIHHCICGYECDSEDKIVDHISYMLSVVGDSSADHNAL